ncbi:MAG: hypothetical protein NVS3B21_35760 [Acidimicrobiales bacterium]
MFEHDEIQDLLGVYALGSVDDDERKAVDDHLPTCESCRSELDRHSEVVALLLAARDQ